MDPDVDLQERSLYVCGANVGGLGFYNAENPAMKQSGHVCFALVAILLLVSCPGCASTARQEGMQKYFDDGIVPIKVKVALFYAPASPVLRRRPPAQAS
jgi:hypothetical protein